VTKDNLIDLKLNKTMKQFIKIIKPNINTKKHTSLKKYGNSSKSIQLCIKSENPFTIGDLINKKKSLEMIKIKKQKVEPIFPKNKQINFFLQRKKKKVNTNTRINSQKRVLNKIQSRKQSSRLFRFFNDNQEEKIKKRFSATLRKRMVRSAYNSIKGIEDSNRPLQSNNTRQFNKILNNFLRTKQKINSCNTKKKSLNQSRHVFDSNFLKNKKNKKHKCKSKPKYKPVYFVPPMKNMKHLFMRKSFCKTCEKIKQRSI
jgi:hypothetical protein